MPTRLIHDADLLSQYQSISYPTLSAMSPFRSLSTAVARPS
jgi:hypothetical protein